MTVHVASAMLVVPAAASAQHAPPLAVVQPPTESVSGPRLRSLGHFSMCQSWGCEQTLSVGLDAALAPVHVGAEVSTGRRVFAEGVERTSDRRMDLVFGPVQRSVWVGYGVTTEDVIGASARQSRLELGTTIRWRALSVDATIGSGAAPGQMKLAQRVVTSVFVTIDSLTGARRADTVSHTVTDSALFGGARWTSTAARIAWTSEHWSVGALVGHLARRDDRRSVWGSLEGARTLGRRFTILANAGTFPSAIASSNTPPRFAVSAALSARTSWLSSAPAPTESSVAGTAAFDVRRLDDERCRLTIRVPGAARVELASDVTAWHPVAMRRLHDDLWVAELTLATGMHQVSVRADGGRWIAPAGLPPTDDDFGGTAGTFVVR
jgi:hypothetical protein